MVKKIGRERGGQKLEKIITMYYYKSVTFFVMLLCTTGNDIRTLTH
jgi:hypothetical protein